MTSSSTSRDLRGSGTSLDRGVARQSPFGPRPVINGGAGMPDQVQCESERTGGDAGTAGRYDRLVERDAGIAEQLGEFFGIAQPASLRVGDPVVGQVAAARNMATAQPGPGFLGRAVEPTLGAGIDDLLPRRRQILEQCALAAY